MSLKNIVSRFVVRRCKINNPVTSVLINNNYDERQHGQYKNGNGKKKITVFVIGSVLVGTTLTDNIFTKKNEKTKEVKSAKTTTTGHVEAGAKRPDLPTYRASEISKHDNKSSFWVTYKHGVYDITKFLPSHPGGDQILNAGGLSVEPFWNVYGMHKTDEILKLLETYRIGNLHDDDVIDQSDDEMWANEPTRDKRLIIKTMQPFNAETPPKLQIQSLDTPNELFYVRQHMPVPEMDAKTHKLDIVIKNSKTSKNVNFNLDDLEKYHTVSVRAALMCAGNRRNEMNKVKPVKGLSWEGGAISNAVWTGVSLREVLLDCGIDPEDVEGKHVIFTGADIDATGENFSTSIPLHMALDPNMKITLATKMNGEPLPLDHGYPLRVIVPGSAAVRSVKWLQSITISDKESSSHWHKKDYRGFNPSKTWETADFSTAPSVYTLPVTSLICDPAEGETVKVKDGMVEVKGYAYSGGGNKIVRVDVTGDGGKNWVEAEITAEDGAPARQYYSWTLWSAKVPVSKGSKQIELWVKATDSNFNTQPEKSNDIWNIRGILNNAYHKIKVKLM